MKFCDKLAKQRKNNNLSQEQLADTLGVSRQAVSKWESGNSYPDMEKIIQISKVLNCTLEDLMDDGTIGVTNKEQKINFNNYLQDLLKFVTKTSNMFSSMSFKEKVKCLFEMFVIFIVLFCIGGIGFAIINGITYELLDIIPFDFKYVIDNILGQIYLVIILILGIIVFIHLFKIRYLDYFITIEDKNVSEKSVEEPVDLKNGKYIEEKEKTKVIIRDPKHSSFSLFHLLGKIIIFFIKMFVVMMAVPTVMSFVFFLIFGVMSLCHIGHGILFFFIFLVFLGLVAVTYVVMYFMYNFIFNREIKFKRMFIVFIISLVVVGVGVGLSSVSLLGYDYVDNAKGIEMKTEVKYLEMNANVNFYRHDFEYVIDNSLTNLKIEATHPKGLSFHIDKQNYIEDQYLDNGENASTYYYVYYDDYDALGIYKLVLKDLDKKIIRSYDSRDMYKVKVYLSEENYNILMNNK